MQATIKDKELIPIGTEISFSHRAGVARFKKRANPSEGKENEFGWIITEGILYHNETVRYPTEDLVGLSLSSLDDDTYWDNRIKYQFWSWPRARHRFGKINKTVFVWPDDGVGWIIGKIRRGIGISEKSGYSPATYYGPAEYDQGYLDVQMYVDLYVVKTQYYGTSFVLCPPWAVS